MMLNNTTCQYSSAFTANSGFQLMFMHNTILDTTDHLSMLLEVLEEGAKEVPKLCQYHFAGRRHIYEFLGPG
jgi:hypothetical protein